VAYDCNIDGLRRLSLTNDKPVDATAKSHSIEVVIHFRSDGVSIVQAQSLTTGFIMEKLDETDCQYVGLQLKRPQHLPSLQDLDEHESPHQLKATLSRCYRRQGVRKLKRSIVVPFLILSLVASIFENSDLSCLHFVAAISAVDLVSGTNLSTPRQGLRHQRLPKGDAPNSASISEGADYSRRIRLSRRSLKEKESNEQKKSKKEEKKEDKNEKREPAKEKQSPTRNSRSSPGQRLNDLDGTRISNRQENDTRSAERNHTSISAENDDPAMSKEAAIQNEMVLISPDLTVVLGGNRPPIQIVSTPATPATSQNISLAESAESRTNAAESEEKIDVPELPESPSTVATDLAASQLILSSSPSTTRVSEAPSSTPSLQSSTPSTAGDSESPSSTPSLAPTTPIGSLTTLSPSDTPSVTPSSAPLFLTQVPSLAPRSTMSAAPSLVPTSELSLSPSAAPSHFDMLPDPRQFNETTTIDETVDINMQTGVVTRTTVVTTIRYEYLNVTGTNSSPGQFDGVSQFPSSSPSRFPISSLSSGASSLEQGNFTTPGGLDLVPTGVNASQELPVTVDGVNSTQTLPDIDPRSRVVVPGTMLGDRTDFAHHSVPGVVVVPAESTPARPSLPHKRRKKKVKSWSLSHGNVLPSDLFFHGK
jgi:hypothetical protein